MDETTEEPEWFPSPIFQELFAKLTRIAKIVSDIFVGRERFATILLMRLTETVILWISDDQSFWEEIETGDKPLGPLGLQQVLSRHGDFNDLCLARKILVEKPSPSYQEHYSSCHRSSFSHWTRSLHDVAGRRMVCGGGADSDKDVDRKRKNG